MLFNECYIYIMSQVYVPKIAKYGLKKEAAITERTYVVTPPGSDSDILPGTTTMISANFTKGPTLKCIYGPNSYGTYQVKISGADAAAYLDGSANCFFSRIKMDAGGNQLEDFNFVNQYIPCVYDYCISPQTRNTFYSAFGNANYNTYLIAGNIDYLA